MSELNQEKTEQKTYTMATNFYKEEYRGRYEGKEKILTVAAGKRKPWGTVLAMDGFRFQSVTNPYRFY
jgi:hypothetical protein